MPEKNDQDEKPIRAVKLKDPRDVKKFMIRTMNDYRRGKVSSQEVRDMGYLAKIILEVQKSVEMEERIDELERRLKEANIA